METVPTPEPPDPEPPDPEPRQRATPPRVEDALQSLVQALLGSATLTASFARSLLAPPAATAGPERGPQAGPSQPAAPSRESTAELLGLAALGLGMAAERRALAVAVAGARTLGRMPPAIAALLPGHTRGAFGGRLRAWSERGRAERAAGVRMAAAMANSAVDTVVPAVMDRLDWEDLAGRIDLDALVDRLDVAAVAGRLDLEALLGQLDLAAMAREVMDDLPVGEVIRESAGSLAVETVSAVRARSAEADVRVAGLVDRLLRRSGPREVGLAARPRSELPRAGGDG